MTERDSSERRHEQEMRPLTEAGEGEAEGFEEAEAELIEHASHGDPGPDPSELAGESEAENPDAVYGEADHAESSEEARDEEPGAGGFEDEPGEGPGSGETGGTGE